MVLPISAAAATTSSSSCNDSARDYRVILMFMQNPGRRRATNLWCTLSGSNKVKFLPLVARESWCTEDKWRFQATPLDISDHPTSHYLMMTGLATLVSFLVPRRQIGGI